MHGIVLGVYMGAKEWECEIGVRGPEVEGVNVAGKGFN